MITSDKFIWLHIGKAAGTSTQHMFKILKQNIDSSIELNDNRYSKHDTIKIRISNYDNVFKYNDIHLNSLNKILNFRRLPSYVLSVSQWNIKYHNEKRNLKFNKDFLLKGFAFGTTEAPSHHCDAILDNYIDLSDNVNWLRSEFINDDFIKLMKSYYKIDNTTIELIKKVNININVDYNKSISYHFSKNELDLLYKSCPKWTTLEEKLYGDLLI